jgi:hypothetical protein
MSNTNDDLDDFPDFDPITGALVEETNVEVEETVIEKPDFKAEELKTAQARIDALERQVQQQHDTPPQQRQQIPQYGNEQEIITGLNAAFAENPGAALYKVLQSIDTIAEKKAREMVAPVNESNVRSAIDNYKRSMSTDPLFPQAEEAFDRLIDEITPEQLAKVPAKGVKKQLDNLYNMAVGESFRKSPNKIPAAPQYGGGSNTGGVSKARKLSQNQQNIIKLGRQYGMTDKDIAASVAEAS